MTDQNDIMQQEQPGGLTTLSSSGAATYGYAQPGPGATGADDGKNGKNGKKRKKGNKGGKALVGAISSSQPSMRTCPAAKPRKSSLPSRRSSFRPSVTMSRST